MNLSPRLQVIADYVPKDSIVADIGTDHGYIPVYLISKKISDRVIATDINLGPLKNAMHYIEKKGYSKEKIETRLGNGLSCLRPHEVDTVIIAGMGGLLIAEILESSKNIAKTISKFILQPMVASEELRRYLYNNDFKIIDEKLAKEGNKIYEIILAEYGKDEITDEIYFDIGRKLIENKDKHLKDFLETKIRKTERILDSLTNNRTGDEKYIYFKDKLRQYKEVLKNL